MQLQTDVQREPYFDLAEPDAPHPWSVATRIAFRFTFIYFSMYILTFPAGGFIPFTDILATKYNQMWNVIVLWVGHHILHVSYPIITGETGSGDRTADWIQLLCLLFFAFIGTLLWSALDRKRTEYKRLSNWFLLILRLSLATTMIVYGAMKMIPVQMPPPDLQRLLQPLGYSTPMGMLWNFIGSSKAYCIIVGSAEMLGGVFLIFPRTTALGAAISIMDMVQVFLLNMCYDVPVKLFSLHSALMGIVLLAPYMRGLANYFFFSRPAKPYVAPPFFRRAWANRMMLFLQIAIGIYLVSIHVHENLTYYLESDKTAPQTPLYGIWSVENFSVDGQVRPPLVTDDLRWQRIIFNFPKLFQLQSMDGKFQRYLLELDLANKKATIKKFDDPHWVANLEVDQPDSGTLEMKGQFDSHLIDAKAKRMDEKQFLLMSRGFHWILERGVNR